MLTLTLMMIPVAVFAAGAYLARFATASARAGAVLPSAILVGIAVAALLFLWANVPREIADEYVAAGFMVMALVPVFFALSVLCGYALSFIGKPPGEDWRDTWASAVLAATLAAVASPFVAIHFAVQTVPFEARQ